MSRTKFNNAVTDYPIKCVIYGPAKSGKTRTLDVVRVLNRDRVMRLLPAE